MNSSLFGHTDTVASPQPILEKVMNSATGDPTNTPSQRLHETFYRQKLASRQQANSSLKQRLGHLSQLEKLLSNHQYAIAEAISLDFGNRPSQETRLLEVFNLISGIHFTRKQLKKWMKPQNRHVGMAFFGARNTVVPQPKGVIGVVTPWNYPLFLALSPCTSALAAGNRCIVKLAANSHISIEASAPSLSRT